MSSSPIARRVVSGPVIGIAAVLLIAGVVPTGSLLGGGSGGVTTVGVGPVRVGLDVLLHALGYGALAAALLLAVDRVTWSVAISAVVVATTFGAGIELLQLTLPWRTGGLLDGFANAVGAILGTAITGAVRVLRRS